MGALAWACDDAGGGTAADAVLDAVADAAADAAVDAATDGVADSATDGVADSATDGVTDSATDMEISEDVGGDGGAVDRCAEVLCSPGEICDPEAGICVAGGPTVDCEADDDCGIGECLTEDETGLPGGLCHIGCARDADCGVDAACVILAEGPMGETAVCLPTCGEGCRDGWVCLWGDTPEASLCVPDCRSLGCGPGGACDSETGLCEPVPAGGQTEGGRCDVESDQCANGLLCIAEAVGGEASCRSLCRPGAGDCARGVCFPLPGEALGVCVTGDGCDPSDPAAVCGRRAACVAVPPDTFCVEGGDGVAGDACGGEGWCAAGLVCQYGRCKTACADRRDCERGEACLTAPEERAGVAYGFCHSGCDPYGQVGCRAEACVLVDILEEEAVGACEPVVGGEGGQGERCAPDPDHYWGSCAADHLCDVLVGEEATCARLCDQTRRGACPAPYLCTPDLFEAPYESLGLCLGGCNVLSARSGCADDEICGFTGLFGFDAEGVARPAGVCTPSAGARGAGEACELDEDSGGHDCRNGHICARLEDNAPRVCVELCDPFRVVAPPCRRGGQRCVTEVFGEGARLGICLPVVP